MRTTEMVLFAHFLKTSKFIPACISIYILSLPSHEHSLTFVFHNIILYYKMVYLALKMVLKESN